MAAAAAVAVAAVAVAVAAVAVVVAAAGVAGLAAGPAAGVLVAWGERKDQSFLDPALLAGSGLWRGQKCPRCQLLGPTRLPESVVERETVLAAGSRQIGRASCRERGVG